MTDIIAELARAIGLLAGNRPDKARDSVQRALELLDQQRARDTEWTVEEILAREG